MLSLEERENIRTLAEASSPGDWEPGVDTFGTMEDMITAMESVLRGGPSLNCHVVFRQERGNEGPLILCMTGNGPNGEANAKMISRAREALLALLADLEYWQTLAIEGQRVSLERSLKHDA